MKISKSLLNWPILNMLEPEFISNIHMVLVHGILGREALIVTHDRMVYALGSNEAGCSGVGHTESSLTPLKVDTLCGKNIKTFAHGSSSHVLALTEDGQVYSWGNNNWYQLGYKYDGTRSSATPTLVKKNLSDRFVVDIACGNSYSLALTGDGEVYEWGRNEQAKHSSLYVTTPTKVQSTFGGTRIVSISCGVFFNMAVTADGEVYGWGNNEYGQLGIGNYASQGQPCKIAELTGIVIERVVCGSEHTLALSNDGILYTWGRNDCGQLGSRRDTKVSRPVQLKVPLIGRVLDMAATHYNHISVAMGEGNRVFVWGKCSERSVRIPMLTSLRCLHDALAYYSKPSVMHKPFLLHVKETTNLTDCLEGAFDDPTTSDLAIRVEGSPIHVHKAILKIRCQYFRTMFQEHWAENNQSVIEHEQFSYDVYRAFLEYLYTDEIDVPIEDALEFLDLTNAYSESQLRSRWIRLIKKDITVRNAIRLYNAAVQYNAKELEEYCCQFAVNHWSAVIRRPCFAKLDELAKKSFIIKGADAGTSETLVESYPNFKMTTSNLMKWEIFKSLEPKFISKIHMVNVFHEATTILTKDGIVYGLGENKYGVFGTGDSSTLSLKEIKAFSGKGIKTLATAAGKVLALTEKGEVYTWDRRYSNKYGYDQTSQDLTATLVEGFPSETFFVDLACGMYHSLALTNDGKVYAWGENTYGQVDGSCTSNENVSRKVGVILPGKRIVYIRCCSASSMAVTDGGEVYSWGCNRNGELGQGNFSDADGVHKVQLPTDVVIEKIACGHAHTLALSNEGVLYVWGVNAFGQLGLGHTNNACTPVKLLVGEMGRVLDVSADSFMHASVAMCEHNRVFLWGLCLGQCLEVPTRTSFDSLDDTFAHLVFNMQQSFIFYSEEKTSITDHLSQAFDDAATSDLTIRVQGKSVHVHKAILKLRSQYFRSRFQEQCAENSQSVMEHQQFCCDVYRAFLEYLYTDQIYLPAENILELLDLAVTYSDSVLRDRCIALSKSGIKVDNVASLYSISIKHHLTELEQVCFNFAVSNMATVVQTPGFAKLDEVAIKSLIIKAAEACAFKR